MIWVLTHMWKVPMSRLRMAGLWIGEMFEPMTRKLQTPQMLEKFR